LEEPEGKRPFGKHRRRWEDNIKMDLHSSPDIEVVIKSMAINGKGKWQARGRKEIYRWLCWKNLKEKDHLENIGVDGKIILKWILKKQD